MSVQILLCCAIHLLCFSLMLAHFLIGYYFVSRDNLQIKRAFILGVPFTHQDFWSYIFNMFKFKFKLFIVIASKCNEISKTTHRGATIS